MSKEQDAPPVRATVGVHEMWSATESSTAQVSVGARRAISRSVVGLLKEHLGRGPVRAKTYIHEDSVFVLMYEGHTVVENTLSGAGQGKAVASQRVISSEVIHDCLSAVIESEMGRKVIGFMSSSQQDPSLLTYVFVLDSTELLKEPVRETPDEGMPEVT